MDASTIYRLIQGGLELGLDLESIEVKSDADFDETTSCRMADWVV